MKRLYKAVAVAGAANGFCIRLDGKAVKTPGRAELAVPTAALAEAIAEEWLAQGPNLLPGTMPLTQLAATAIDHIPVHRADVEAATLRFADTDVVCYRAEAPPALVALQDMHWQPLLDWAAQSYGLAFVTVSSLLPVEQPPAVREAIGRRIGAMDDWSFCAYQAAAAASGSAVIALALMDGRIDAQTAFAAAELESGYEIARWGEDPEALARRATVAADLAAARRFHDLLAIAP